jgi:hypothetical protein
MSVKIMSDVFEKSKTEGNTRLVLLCLADCANDEGACWPSIRKIAQKANLSEPMTKKHLNALIATGVVRREEREDHSGRQTSNFYTVDVAKIGDDEIGRDVWEQVTPVSRQQKFGGVTKVTGGGGNSSQGVGGVTEGSLSYMNHHKEPKKEPSEESSAKASHSTAEDLSEQQLFPKCADARSGKSDDLNSRPPHSEEERVQRGSRKSPPKKREPKIADETFIAKLKEIYPDLDIDTELRKMDAWLLANPTRKKSQQFVSNWINRAAERVAKNNPPKQTCPDEKEDPEGFNAFWASVKPND